jgi:hypothetical protein
MTPARGNVIPLRRETGRLNPVIQPTPSPFDHLTATLVLAQHRAGTLPEAVLIALLAGAGLRP